METLRVKIERQDPAKTFQPCEFLNMNSQYTFTLTLFSIAVLSISATAKPGGTTSIGVESSNLVMWGDSARECFENPKSPSADSVNVECWSKKVMMLIPLLADKSMTLSTAMIQIEASSDDDFFLNSTFGCTEFLFFNLLI